MCLSLPRYVVAIDHAAPLPTIDLQQIARAPRHTPPDGRPPVLRPDVHTDCAGAPLADRRGVRRLNTQPIQLQLAFTVVPVMQSDSSLSEIGWH